MPASVRLMAASPKVLADRVRGLLGGIGSTTAPDGGLLVGSLIAPSKLPVRAWTGPQHGTVLLASQTVAGLPLVTQRWNPSTGVVPPWARSYLISTSPAVRTGVTPLPLTCVDWLNSKSMLVVPDGSCTRSQARYRNSLPATRWLAT